MPTLSERPTLDILKMSRRAVAAVPFLGRNDLSEKDVQTNAELLDEAIQAQFPESQEIKRLPLATGLARQLGDPHPHKVTARLYAFYKARSRLQKDADPSGETPEAPVASRCQIPSQKER